MNLSHTFLIAMPSMNDEWFSHSVVYICRHDKNGAIGIIINKPSDVNVSSIFSKNNLPLPRKEFIDMPLLRGGPTETHRGLILHDGQHIDPMNNQKFSYKKTIRISKSGIQLTGSDDILEDFSKGQGPKRAIFCLGFCSWKPGQLESEIMENQWLTHRFKDYFVFETPLNKRYIKMINNLGFSPYQLYPKAGHG